ncbi:hypothetical protein N431DRAFT_463577 [Stipitochalara longipes BDJ]|nr:hypothetical protein N431DRAFT_463577 [Stipitochalara longipes BDJ]
MALCWLSLILLLIYTFSTYANASFTLTPEVTNFIPTCAQACFISFLDSNFEPTTCGTTPALDCLCSHNTTTGYTVGEGAVQCIISEDNIGFCKGNDAQKSVVLTAFNMCAGQANALPNTHATITATLVVESSMPSIVLVASNPTTTQTINWSNTMSIKSTSTTAFVTSTGTPSKSAPAGGTYSAMASSMSPTPSATVPLTRPQIIGITVASIGGGTVALGCLIIFACWRRRQYRKARESNLLPFQMDPSTGSTEHKFEGFKGPTERGGPGKLNGLAGRIPPKVPPRLEISNPNMFSRRSVMQETIGLAISPETKINQQRQQRQSRLLPEKPNLKLQMVPSQARRQPGGLAFSQPVTRPLDVSRQSTATQFEEDEESADTAMARDDTWRSNSGGPEQIWDYSTGRWITTRPADSPPQIQVLPRNTTGGEGQSELPGQASNVTMSPNSYVKPLTLGSKVGSFSQPRRPDAYQKPQPQQYQQQYQQQPQPQQQQQQQPRLGIPTQNGRPITATSSIYSQRGSLPASEVARHSNHHARRSYRQAGPYDHNSIGSLTSFDTEGSIVSPVDQDPKTAEALSPVMESPASGRSPVSYPKIPGRLSATTIRLVPPPPQPDFTKALGSQAGAGKPWRQAEIAAQRERERAQVQSQQQERQPVRPFRLASSQQRGDSEDTAYEYPAPPAKAAARSQARVPPQYQKEAPPQNYYLPRLQTQIQNKIPPPPSKPPLTDATGGWGFTPSDSSLAPKPLQLHPSITFTRSSSTMSQYSTASKISTSSSLLAKRRGEQKATALTLLKNEEEKKRNGKWRVLGKEDIEEAKKVDWRPMLASGRGEDKGEYEARTGQQLERTELPNTPGWVPKLTPTRRGDELFLSVQ